MDCELVLRKGPQHKFHLGGYVVPCGVLAITVPEAQVGMRVVRSNAKPKLSCAGSIQSIWTLDGYDSVELIAGATDTITAHRVVLCLFRGGADTSRVTRRLLESEVAVEVGL